MDRPETVWIDYEDDLVGWIEHQVRLLRAKDFEQLDVEHLVEEFDDMVSRKQRELCSRLHQIIKHLLKCQYQPKRKSTSWTATLDEQRAAIERKLKRSPSYRNAIGLLARQEYPRVIRSAARETRLPPCTFPPELPYTPEQLLDDDFIP
ncbi:MAG TPA: DUF29 domain-containing protein [Telluria sp.]|jgi:hypothetical protein